MTACFLITMALLYFVFKRGNSILMATALLACICKCPGLFMVSVGLAMTPGAAVPVCFGVLLNALIDVSKSEYSVLFSQTSTLSSLERVSYVLNALMQNAYMWLMLVTMVSVMTVVYLIRRMKIDYSWMIAIGSGALLYLIIMLIGTYAFDIRISIVTCILNSIGAVAVGLVFQLFCFSVDYSRTEYVQFEDDEYYYYVKAVPKISVALSNKKVKHITEATGYIAKQVAEKEES